MRKILVAFCTILFLNGCAIQYFYDGQKYDSKEKYYQAVEEKKVRALATVTPHVKPISNKKLIFAIPTAAALTDQDIKNYVQTRGTQPTELQAQMLRDLNPGTFQSIKAFYEAVQKKNIYASTQFVELDTTNGNIEPSQDTDALFLVFPGPSAVQWYYASKKHGKQLFAYDRSSPTSEGKMQSFIEAAQAQAIRE